MQGKKDFESLDLRKEPFSAPDHSDNQLESFIRCASFDEKLLWIPTASYNAVIYMDFIFWAQKS